MQSFKLLQGTKQEWFFFIFIPKRGQQIFFFTYQGPESKYINPWGSYGLMLQLLKSVTVAWKQLWTIHKQMLWLSSNNFMDSKTRIPYNVQVMKHSSFFQPFKMWKPSPWWLHRKADFEIIGKLDYELVLEILGNYFVRYNNDHEIMK